MVDADDVRREAAPLPRVEERFVRTCVSYRVGRYVLDARRMVVPESVAKASLDGSDSPPRGPGRR